MEFNLKIATTKEQSERLLALGLKPETADYLTGTHIEDCPIECCVSMIGWLINNKHFNKEYLK